MLRTPRHRSSMQPYRTATPPSVAPRSRWRGAGHEIFLAALLLAPVVAGVVRGRFGGEEAASLILAALVARATWRWVRAR